MLLASCSVLKTNTATSKTLNIYSAGIVQKPLLVDLEVKEKKVTGTAVGLSTSFEIVKQNAVANALEKVNADVLVEPSYKTESSNGKVTATVTGYPAVYKNFRPIKEEDFKLIERAGISQATVVQETRQTNEKPKKKGGAVGLILGTVAAAVLIPLIIIAALW